MQRLGVHDYDSQPKPQQPQPQQSMQQSQHDEPVVHSSRYEAAKSQSNGPITTQQRQEQNEVHVVIDKFNIPWDEITHKKVITEDGQVLGRIDKILPPYARVSIFNQKPIHHEGEDKYIPKTYHINKTFFKRYDPSNLYIACTKEYAINNLDKIPPREEFEREEDIEYYKERYIDTDKTKSYERGQTKRQQQPYSQATQDLKITQITKELSSAVSTIDKNLEVERSRALYLYDLDTKSQITKRGQEYIVPLPGIKFPANKDKMIEHAKKAKYPLKGNWRSIGKDRSKLIEEMERNGTKKKLVNIHIEHIRQLPNETYNNKSELEKDLRIIYRNKYRNNDKMYEGRTIVIVDDTVDEI